MKITTLKSVYQAGIFRQCYHNEIILPLHRAMIYESTMYYSTNIDMSVKFEADVFVVFVFLNIFSLL